MLQVAWQISLTHHSNCHIYGPVQPHPMNSFQIGCFAVFWRVAPWCFVFIFSGTTGTGCFINNIYIFQPGRVYTEDKKGKGGEIKFHPIFSKNFKT